MAQPTSSPPHPVEPAGASAAPAGWQLLHAGKVRELYTPDPAPCASASDPERVLVVASDRISAFDHVLATPIPGKGAILTALSLWWFEQLDSWDLGLRHHVLGAGTADGVPPDLLGRAMVCRRLDMLSVECIVRGYLAGSGLADYQATGAVGGIELPPGLRAGDRLHQAIFTPSTKAALGEHDENVNLAAIAGLVGEDLAVRAREVSLRIYERAAQVAADRGVVIADTKLELGLDPRLYPTDPAALVVGDELLTPDSSRFWPAEDWAPGRSQPSFDKQYVRDWLRSPASGWAPSSGEEPPPLPEDVVERTRDRYIEAYQRLTGRRWT